MSDGLADKVARAICAEKCAFYGDPPCWKVGEWPNKQCDEPGCEWLAKAAVADIHTERAAEKASHEERNQNYMQLLKEARAELAAARELLKEAIIYVLAQNEAEGIVEGFGPRKPRPSDGLLARIDAALKGDADE